MELWAGAATASARKMQARTSSAAHKIVRRAHAAVMESAEETKILDTAQWTA